MYTKLCMTSLHSTDIKIYCQWIFEGCNHVSPTPVAVRAHAHTRSPVRSKAAEEARQKTIRAPLFGRKVGCAAPVASAGGAQFGNGEREGWSSAAFGAACAHQTLLIEQTVKQSWSGNICYAAICVIFKNITGVSEHPRHQCHIYAWYLNKKKSEMRKTVVKSAEGEVTGVWGELWGRLIQTVLLKMCFFCFLCFCCGIVNKRLSQNGGRSR